MGSCNSCTCIESIEKAGAKQIDGNDIPVKYTYEEAKLRFRPLDVIAFRGTGFLNNGVVLVESIKNVLGGDDFKKEVWTHVGLLVNSEILPKEILKTESTNQWFIWESSTSYSVPDVENKLIMKGVQIRELKAVCDEYAKYADTEITVFPLQANPWTDVKSNDVGQRSEGEHEEGDQKQIFKTQLKQLHEFYRGRPYDFTGQCAALCCCLRGIRDNVHPLIKSIHEYAIFSSELVAAVYKRLKVLPGDTNVENITPNDLICDDNKLVKSDASINILQTGKYVTMQ